MKVLCDFQLHALILSPTEPPPNIDIAHNAAILHNCMVAFNPRVLSSYGFKFHDGYLERLVIYQVVNPLSAQAANLAGYKRIPIC